MSRSRGKGPSRRSHFWVGKKGKSEWKPKDPMLVYSRPKGTYNGSKADHVLVDWYLVNAELGEGKYSIKATVSGPGIEGDRTLKITEWKPYALDNLRNGDYKVSLELDDKDGKAVPGAWNSTTRTITINRDAADDPAPTPAAAVTPEKKEEKPKAEKADKQDQRREAQGRQGPKKRSPRLTSPKKRSPRPTSPKKRSPRAKRRSNALAFLSDPSNNETPARNSRGRFSFVAAMGNGSRRDLLRARPGVY